MERSGYLYAAIHPTNEKWVKIGFTRLTPLSRLHSLSQTSLREPFILHDSRFMWDVLYTEKEAHSLLEKHNYKRQKEFFEIDKNEIKSFFNYLEEIDLKNYNNQVIRTSLYDENISDEDFEKMINSFDDLSFVEKDLVSWAQDDLDSRWKYIQQNGTRELERRSALGDFNSTIVLAKFIAIKGVSQSNIVYCQTLANAAEKQGLEEASLLGLLWKTLVDKESFNEYWPKINYWKEKMGQNEPVPDMVNEVFEVENVLSTNFPHRSASWSVWYSNSLSSTSLPLKRSL